MTWQDEPIPKDDEGHPKYRGFIALNNDKKEKLASIVWFYDGGPFYAYAMDVNDTATIRRIGPCTTLDGAKKACGAAIEGTMNISGRAGYPRL